MENIEIKRINNELYLKLNDLVDFQSIYDKLDEKLNMIKEQNINEKLMINLLLGYRDISSQDLFCLFELILKDEKILLKSIEYNPLKKENIEIYNGTIRGGETKIFENSGLILGDVNPNALVIAKDELFIVGKLKGKVIIRNKEGKVDASSYHNAYIKIFDKINTNFSYDNPLFINYLNLNETPKRGTKVWQE
jgi:hypothetical protein